MPDHEDSSVAIALLALDPLLTSLRSLLTERDLLPQTVEELIDATAEIYAVGYRDGARHAVGEIAPEAERHGLRLWLGPDLEEFAGPP